MSLENRNFKKEWKNDGFDNYQASLDDLMPRYMDKMRHLHGLEISFYADIKNIYEKIPYGTSKMVFSVSGRDTYRFCKGLDTLMGIEYSFHIDENLSWLDLWRMVDRVLINDRIDAFSLEGFDFTPTPDSKRYKGIIKPYLLYMK